MATPTQSQHPWRATVRTVFAAVVGFCALAPMIVSALGLPQVPAVVLALAVTGGITRVLAIPQVNIYLQVFFPWLAASPLPPADEDEVPEAEEADQNFS